MILYHAADLIWATRIKSTAEAAGLAARPVRTVEMLVARLADSPARGLVVDLEAPEVALALIGKVRAPTPSPIRVLAYGPHVLVDLFRQAREAGADAVMARGGFAAGLTKILAELDRE